MMMEAVQTSETLVNLQQSTWCYNPEDSHLCTHHCENLKSYLKNNLSRLKYANKIALEADFDKKYSSFIIFRIFLFQENI
jgi:hypothetical protein